MSPWNPYFMGVFRDSLCAIGHPIGQKINQRPNSQGWRLWAEWPASLLLEQTPIPRHVDPAGWGLENSLSVSSCAGCSWICPAFPAMCCVGRSSFLNSSYLSMRRQVLGYRCEWRVLIFGLMRPMRRPAPATHHLQPSGGSHLVQVAEPP